MRFYTKQHLYYCGVDLHTRSIFVCIIKNRVNTVDNKNIPAHPDWFLKVIAPYHENIVVGVWIAKHQ